MEKQPPKYVSPSGTWKSKLTLRAASLLFLVIISGVGGSLATTPRVYFMDVMLIALLPAIVITFAWNIAEIICLCVRGGHRGIHPGAIVAIDLLAWLGWVVVDFVLGFSGVARKGYYFIDDWSGYQTDRSGYRYGSSDSSRVTAEDKRLQAEIEGKGTALIAFVSLTVLVHFALFVIGCFETNIRNKMPRTVYVMQPIYGPPQGGYQPLGYVPAQLPQGQPFPGQAFPGQAYAPNQMFVQVPAGQMPVQPAPAVTADAKPGAERLA